MKTGDIVRFTTRLEGDEWCDDDDIKPRLGLLVEYHSWKKIASVLYEGKIHRWPGRLVEKAGKKDHEQTRA